MSALLAVRVEIPQDSTDENEREYLMSTERLVEQWERRVADKGRAEGARQTLLTLYQARFGAVPGAIAEAIDATDDTATLERWIILAATRSSEEVADAVQASLDSVKAS